MNALIKEVLAQGGFGAFQSTALLIFVGIMAFVCGWILLPGAKGYYERIADDVLEGGE